MLERFPDAEAGVTDRIREILKHARDVRQVIFGVSDTIRPKDGSVAAVAGGQTRSLMLRKRVLVVDADDEIRRNAHELLGRFGCDVETAHDAEECFLLARSYHYDAVLSDIRLPDRKGYEVFEELLKIDPLMPVLLMTGYGYDPTHSIVKARQAGCKSILFKPFKVDQLVTELEKAFTAPGDLDSAEPTAS